MNLLTAIWGVLSLVLTKLGLFMKPIIKSGEDIYDLLTEDEKKAAQWSSGLIAIVNNNIDKTPSVIIQLVQTKFPDLSLDVIHGFIDTLLNKLKFVQGEIPLTLEDAVAKLQAFLKQHEGDHNVWGIISKAAVTVLTLLFSPGSEAQKIEASLEYIYHLIVVPHVTATPTAEQ
jgi:hypothetical protein